MTVYLPSDPVPSRYVVGDVFMIQHGPKIPNVFMWIVTVIDAHGLATETKFIHADQHFLYKAYIDRFVAQAGKK